MYACNFQGVFRYKWATQLCSYLFYTYACLAKTGPQSLQNIDLYKTCCDRQHPRLPYFLWVLYVLILPVNMQVNASNASPYPSTKFGWNFRFPSRLILYTEKQLWLQLDTICPAASTNLCIEIWIYFHWPSVALEYACKRIFNWYSTSKFGMTTYIWPLHVPTKLHVHRMYIFREMEFGPPPIAPSNWKKKCRDTLNRLWNTNLDDSFFCIKKFSFGQKVKNCHFLTFTFGCRKFLPFLNRGFILSAVRYRSVIYDPTDICIHSLKHLRDIYGQIFNLKYV